MKTCISCGRNRRLGSFYIHAAMSDGHLGKCKDCCKRDALIARSNRLTEVREYDRKRSNQPSRVEARRRYAKTEGGREKSIKAKRAWDERNRDKKKAQTSVHNAIRDGKLIKGTACSRCGLPGKLEAHHHDYSKPLEVLWVHDSCHKAIHKEERAARRATGK